MSLKAFKMPTCCTVIYNTMRHSSAATTGSVSPKTVWEQIMYGNPDTGAAERCVRTNTLTNMKIS